MMVLMTTWSISNCCPNRMAWMKQVVNRRILIRWVERICKESSKNPSWLRKANRRNICQKLLKSIIQQNGNQKKLSKSEILNLWKERKKTRIKSRHAEYMPDWQKGDLKGLTKHGHPKIVTKINSIHVPMEHANQKRIIQTLQGKQGLPFFLSQRMARIRVS